MAQYHITLGEYWKIIKKRKFFILSVTVLLALFNAALAVVRAPSPIYEATCSIKYEKAVFPLGLYATFITFGSGSEIETQMAMIKGYSVFKKTAFAMGLADESDYSERGLAEVITGLQAGITVTREGYSNIVNITAKTQSPEFSAKLANQVAIAYRETHAEDVHQRAGEVIEFIRDQLEEAGSRLRKSEDRLRRFKMNKQVVLLGSQSDILLSRSGAVEALLAKTIETEEELHDIVARIKESPGIGSRASFFSEKTTEMYQKLNLRLIDLMIERDTLLLQYTIVHPQVIEVDKQVEVIKGKMIAELESQLKMQEKRERRLRKELAGLREELHSMPDKGLDLAGFEKAAERNADIYTLLESKYQEALIRNVEKPEEVVIVKPAFEPLKPVNPPKTMASGFMGAMIGLVLGLAFAFIVEAFDTSIRSIDEVEQTLGLAVMGVIPHIDERDIQQDLKEQYEREAASDALLRNARLIPHFGPKSILAESFRSFRMNLQFSALEQDIKTIVVTSAVAEEGKTTVVANLAIALAEGGLKTLLMETDLRKPTIYRMFGLEPTPGIADHLLSNYELPEVLRTVTDIMMGKMNMDKIILTPGIDNLHIMTCGTIPLNPAELIQSKKFKDLLAELRDQYDVILMDSPSLVSTADAFVLATGADGVLLTYRAGKAARGILRRVTSQLEQIKATIIGVVLNEVKAEISPGFEEFKKFKYYAYYGEEGKKKNRTKSSSSKLLALILLISALIILIASILWQTGIIDLNRYLLPQKTRSEQQADFIRSKRKPIEVRKAGEPNTAFFAEAALNSGSSNYPYSVLTGSFRERETAIKEISSLKAKGFSPYWTYVDLGAKGRWYRVFAGHFETSEGAEGFKKSLNIPGAGVLKTAYTNEIGSFASRDEMEQKAVSLREAGYCPYSINDAYGRYRLLIGAYVTKEGAEEMARLLKKTGIESSVVLR